ncbi:hypothetical protein D3C83_20420 [compost metagenome]
MPGGIEPISKLKHDDPAVVTVQIPRAVVVEEEVAAPVTEIIGEVPGEGEAAPAPESEKKEPEKKEPGKKE